MTHSHDGKRRQSKDRLNMNILSVTLSELDMEAASRGVPVSTFCAKLLDILASDSTLLENVLDGEMPRKKELA